uniref:Uncharacterized protein n=1 Tax=Ditylenchus dipsaci TaxID=166011 RepID=A0A915EH10_9BILA
MSARVSYGTTARPAKLPAHLRVVWFQWKQEEKTIQQKHKLQLLDYEKRQKEAKDARRDKDFKDAVDKVSRAGYTGKHGSFVVPKEDAIQMQAWHKQATLGIMQTNS